MPAKKASLSRRGDLRRFGCRPLTGSLTGSLCLYSKILFHFIRPIRRDTQVARVGMAGDGGSEDPRVKPAPGGEEGVYYVEVRPRTLSRPFRPAAPLPSLLSPKRIPGKIALKLLPHLTPRPPPSSLLLLLAERGYRSCGHVEGRGPLPAHRAPRLRLLRRGVQGARQTHGPNRCVEASPRCAPNRRRRAPGPPRGRRPEPPGPPEHHQDLQHLPHPSDIGRAGTRPRHVHAQTGVCRSLRRVRVRHGRGPVRLTR